MVIASSAIGTLTNLAVHSRSDMTLRREIWKQEKLWDGLSGLADCPQADVAQMAHRCQEYLHQDQEEEEKPRLWSKPTTPTQLVI